MDAREIQSKGNALQKAIAAREPTANIINILKDLQKNVKPSEELLRNTQIGKIVNKVKGVQGFDPTVPQLASSIVSQWRNTVNQQKSANSGRNTPNGTASPAPPSKAGTTTSTSQVSPKDEAPPGVPADKRTWKTDKVPRDSLTSEPGRNNSIGLLYDGLAPGSTLPMQKILTVAKEVEAQAISLPQSNGTHTSTGYKDKIRSLYQNLKAKSNPTLRQKVLNGRITPVQFVTMSHEEMKSRAQREADEKLKKENMNNAMVAQEEKSVSSSLECGKCHQKRVSFTQAQTRSADEPMTTFCECLNCGNRWKFA